MGLRARGAQTFRNRIPSSQTLVTNPIGGGACVKNQLVSAYVTVNYPAKCGEAEKGCPEMMPESYCEGRPLPCTCTGETVVIDENDGRLIRLAGGEEARSHSSTYSSTTS